MSDRKRIKTSHPGIYYRETAAGRTYIVWYTGTDGKARFENVPGGERDAIRYRAKVIDRIAHGHKVAPTRTLFSTFARGWLEEQVNLRATSYEAYKYGIEKHLIPRLGERTKLSAIDVNRVASMISQMQREGLAPGTIRHVLKPLSRVMATAVRRGMVGVNPVSLLDRSERPQGSSMKMNILDSEEIRLFLSKASETYYPLLATAIFTGLRRGELLSLRWEDVDWNAGVIRVGESKTSAGVREVVLMDSLKQILATHSLKCESLDSEWVFPNRNGAKMNPRTVGRCALKPTLERAGITKRIRFHDLRHTFASMLISHGHEPTYVAEQMGHTSASFTLKTYGHLMDRDRKRETQRRRMEEAFGEVLS